MEKEPHALTIRLENITGINKSTIWKILTDQMHYKLYVSKWIPNPIREDIKEKRVKMAVDILSVLEKCKTAWMDTKQEMSPGFFMLMNMISNSSLKILQYEKKRYFRFILAFVDLY